MPRPAINANFSPDPLLAEIQDGLRAEPKSLPCKYFYDERGAHLFERICSVPEYYPTNAELDIMGRHAGEMAACIGPDALVIEYGSGSGRKTRLLLGALDDPAAYVPVDISAQQLQATAARLAAEFPALAVFPVRADYTRPYTLPSPDRAPRRCIAYFPGSTIGNFEPANARGFLRAIAETCGRGGGLLIGVDLKKDERILEAAYNDAEGVTAAFNLNLLVHLNRVFGTDFDPEQFCHRAIYNAEHSRIEMHLESRIEQQVHVGGEEVLFQAGETVCTEYSYKYHLDEFAALAHSAGFAVDAVWLDDREYFSVQFLTVA